MYVLAYEAAGLSLDVYRKPNRPILPSGYELLVDCPANMQKHGYFGAAYIKVTNGEIDLVIAHRGTVIGLYDVWEDFEMWLIHKAPTQFVEAALPFVKYAINFLKKKYPGYFFWVTYTGHSLGACIAELCCAYDKNQFFPSQYTFTFESPGSKPLISSLIAAKVIPEDGMARAENAVVTYNADVNAINSCMEHVGMLNGPCFVGYDQIKNDPDAYPLVPDPICFFNRYTCDDQHSIAKMYHYLQNNVAPPYRSWEWPIGFAAAYKYYLNYNPYFTQHYQYWDNYIQTCWDNHPEIHLFYKNDEKNFADFFIKYALRNDYHASYKKLLVNSFEASTLRNLSVFFNNNSSLQVQGQLEKKLELQGHLTLTERAKLLELREQALVADAICEQCQLLEEKLDTLGQLDLAERQKLANFRLLSSLFDEHTIKNISYEGDDETLLTVQIGIQKN